jgi:adenosylcobinamide-phosphate synthase
MYSLSFRSSALVGGNIFAFVVAICVLVLALVLDILLGDPSPNDPSSIGFRLHPTVWMGTFTKKLEKHLKNPNPRIEKLNGVLLAITVILTFSVPVYLGLWALSTYLTFVAYGVVGIILLKFTVCIKLETNWTKAAAKAIEEDDLVEARTYAHFSRRDAKDLTGSQIGSAVIESMAENLTDFKLSPILAFAFLGVFGAYAFRALNTLDGTVGFKDEEHINIGWFSAKLDTIVNYVPARIVTALIIASSFLLGYDYKNAWAVAKRDNAKTPSLNHGWPMGAMAGALRIQLEKPGKYILGDEQEKLSSTKVLGALKIRNMVIILSVLLSLPIIFLMRLLIFPF